MFESYDINDILQSVDILNKKSKGNSDKILPAHNANNTINSKFDFSTKNKIPIDVDKIITEAENTKKKISSIPKVIVPNKESFSYLNDKNKTFEEIKDTIIKDLYSRLTKRVKKNTLKIIFDLNIKIKDLEKQLENFQTKKKQSLNTNKNVLEDKTVESSKILDPSIITLNKTLAKNKNFLKDDIVTSLQIQDSTINILNKKIKNFKYSEEKLRTQLIDLEQDKIILLNKAKKFEEVEDYKNIINDIKEMLKSIYKKVAKQKIFFLDLKNYSLKTKRDFSFYKENYEKLIIENNDIKKKLSNTKQQVEAFEEIKKELAYTFENFNNVLSKNSIIKLNESFSKITSTPVIPDGVNKKTK